MIYPLRLTGGFLLCCLSFSLTAEQSLFNENKTYQEQIIRLEDNLSAVKNLIQDKWSTRDTKLQRHTVIAFSETSFNSLQQNGLNEAKLRSINDRLEQSMSFLNSISTLQKDIEIEPIEIRPSDCSSSSYEAVYGLKITKTIAEEVLSLAKWECREEAFGENAALACLAAEETVQLAEAVVETQSVCLSAQGNAKADALLETIHNVTEHLNENLSVAVSTLASTDQVDIVINNSTEINQILDNTLPIQLPYIQNALDNLLQTMSANDQKILDLQTRTTDLIQRQQLNEAESIDIDQRLADIDLLLSEIRNDTQLMQQNILLLDNLLQQQPNLNQLDIGHMSWVMSLELGQNIVDFQIPIIYGGRLEHIRELVSQSIIKASEAGIKTTTGEVYFQQGDVSYNSSDYQNAYTFYAKAFRSLSIIEKTKKCVGGACND